MLAPATSRSWLDGTSIGAKISTADCRYIRDRLVLILQAVQSCTRIFSCNAQMETRTHPTRCADRLFLAITDTNSNALSSLCSIRISEQDVKSDKRGCRYPAIRLKAEEATLLTPLYTSEGQRLIARISIGA